MYFMREKQSVLSSKDPESAAASISTIPPLSPPLPPSPPPESSQESRNRAFDDLTPSSYLIFPPKNKLESRESQSEFHVSINRHYYPSFDLAIRLQRLKYTVAMNDLRSRLTESRRERKKRNRSN
ncbi:hypothetical protein AKJ16_DCAP17231 [Drosera capensis]